MDLGDIHVGTALAVDGQTYIVVTATHVKMGRGGAVLKTKLKNLKTGSVVDRTLKPNDSYDEADVSRTKATYLYADGKGYTFMDGLSFEQFTLTAEALGSATKFLAEGTVVDVLTIDNEPIGIDLPKKLEFAVTETPPNVKGNTSSGGTKPATLTTGAIVSVPLFINEGDIIRVNTTDGSYVERVTS